MKKILAFFLCAATVLFCAISVNAHPGRTDSKGGHTNRSTGEYHYHHGYSAHNHRDMDGDGDIDCPYEFDDKTGSNSNKSGNKSNQSRPNTQSNNKKYTSSTKSPGNSNKSDSFNLKTFVTDTLPEYFMKAMLFLICGVAFLPFFSFLNKRVVEAITCILVALLFILGALWGLCYIASGLISLFSFLAQ